MIMRIGSGPEQWQMLYINSDHESFPRGGKQRRAAAWEHEAEPKQAEQQGK